MRKLGKKTVQKILKFILSKHAINLIPISFLERKNIKQCHGLLTRFISILRYLLTKRNREAWRLNREIHALILKIVKQNGAEEKNLLSAILRDVSMDHMGPKEADEFIVDNCKSIFFAGHESTAVTATWCLMLLGMYPEWQERVRSEVRDVCGGEPSDAKSLQKMKIVRYFLQPFTLIGKLCFLLLF